ncbi:MAG: DUF5711 family protein [Oscillospiraceae bacterium]|nr:DUF5711 family protein [Oscillospiraceae bacterium]
MESGKVKDFAEIRKNKKKKRNMQKFVAAMIFLLLALGLYVSRSRWLPSSGYRNNVFSNKEISDGNFPLSITNGINYQACKLGDNFVLLSDTQFYIYSVSGSLIESRQLTYSNAVLKSANNKALVYESGGNNFKVEGKRKTIYEKKTDDTIISAYISDKGYVAVITTSTQYVCTLSVYDTVGNQMYFRGCVEKVISVAFNKASTGCVLVTIDAAEGQIVSKAVSINFDSSEDNWTTENMDSLCISSYMTDDGGIFLFGDTQCAYYDSEGNAEPGYSYESTLIDATFTDGHAAMIFENEERRKTSLVLIDNHESTPQETVIDNNVKCIFAEGDIVYIMTSESIQAYNYKGELLKSEAISESYREFYKIDDYILLLGYNKIDRIEFSIKK